MRQPWRMRRRKQLPATKPCTPDGCGCWLKVIPNDSVRNLSWQAVGLRAPSVLWNFVFERRRFRQFLSSLAEWCAAYWVKGRRWAAAVKFPATTVPTRRPSSPLWSHSEVRTIQPKPLGEAEFPTRQCAHQRGGISILSLVFPTSGRRDVLPNYSE